MAASAGGRGLLGHGQDLFGGAGDCSGPGPPAEVWQNEIWLFPLCLLQSHCSHPLKQEVTSLTPSQKVDGFHLSVCVSVCVCNTLSSHHLQSPHCWLKLLQVL